MTISPMLANCCIPLLLSGGQQWLTGALVKLTTLGGEEIEGEVSDHETDDGLTPWAYHIRAQPHPRCPHS